MGILVSLLLILRSVIVGTTLQVRVFAQSLFGNQLFGLGILFFKSPAAKILGAVATKMVDTWRVVVAFKKGWNKLMF